MTLIRLALMFASVVALACTRPAPEAERPETPPSALVADAPSAAEEPAPDEPGLPAVVAEQGGDCSGGHRCAEGLECVRYYGIAGARGPEFATCERRCADGGTCPLGQRCVTIADGPGEVCRPE